MSETIVLGGGCFWCLEASFQLINGVSRVVSGYSGGAEKDAEYYTVNSGKTDHAEVVSVTFDPDVISLDAILDVFWAIHNPTTPNQQGADKGPQYRSIIFYTAETQLPVIEESLAAVAKLWQDPIVTGVQPLEAFYEAEEYHQNYFANNPSQAYCQIIINPKLEKLRSKYVALLK